MNPKIISPMGWGNGAYVVHKLLEAHLPNYRVVSYHPYWTLFPFALRMAAPTKGAALIHTNPDYGLFFQKRNVPLVLTLHNYVLDHWMHSYSTWAQRVHYSTDLRLFTWISLNHADAITAVSHYTAAIAQEDLRISKPIRVIYDGIDTDRFTPPIRPASPQREIKVFFSGNISLRKGAQWLPEIAQRLDKNITIYYTQGLRGKNDIPAAPNLQPIGAVTYENMPDRYREMDILLMPTVREGFGLSVAEAMATALPVVASDCSSIPELVDNGEGGYLCPVGDVGAFAEKINFLAANPSLRKEMGEYNRDKAVRMFRLDQMVEGYKQLFEEVLDSRR
ncbi:MAG: glycosyltransferase family 4 protein [Desulfomonilia bacterium]|jgi:glycosyltransferase involved in cell wall biosynthesis